MVLELAAALSSHRLSIFAPPDNNYWHVFMWAGRPYAANLYICDRTTDTLLDLFPLVAGAAEMGTPLTERQRVADWIPLPSAGRA
ncbi:hypothetical protein [Cupriavidus sp. TMH.W2]|uniref:hypothetical protein n=1 Tax=Cupriavidus sp. TMH.W2 TaxID=3434465 RepID=UPI003D76F288